MNIGTKIKELRINKKATQEDIARSLQVSTQAVSKWENGGLPDIELIPKIAELFKVSTDYLLGVETNNFKDLEQKVCDYMGTVDEKDRFYKMLELGYYEIVGSFKKANIKEYDYKNIIGADGANSQFKSENGIALASLKKEKPFFAVFPMPSSSNYRAVIKSKEWQLKFFKDLSDKDFYDALIFIYSRENTYFTEELLTKNLNIPIEKSIKVINRLTELRLLFVEPVELDDKKINTYSLYDNPALIGLLTFADMIIDRPNNFYFSVNNKSSKFF